MPTTKSYSNLANGNYTFHVKARDQAGNEDTTPATRTFTVTGAPIGGLVVAYAFGEGSGTTTQDWSGNGNQGALVVK